MAPVIRAARRDDLPAVSALLIAQLRDHGNALPDAALAAAVRGLLERPRRGCFLVAELDGALVGLAALSYLWTLERGGRAAWLDELYVLPERRGAGLGQALLEAAIATAAAAGATALDLEIEAGRERVESLYRRNGFHAEARRRWARPIEAPAAVVPPLPAGLTGGCACGAVRYQLEAAPSDVCHCHCRLCQRHAGAVPVAWLTVARAAWRLLAGAPRQRRSSAHATRGFCADCGTPLTFASDRQPESIDVTVASLDRPELAPPRAHIWTASTPPWLHLDDELPRHPGGAPR